MNMYDGIGLEMEHELSVTRKILERVPTDKFGWKPHAKSMTLGQLAAHVAEIPGWMEPAILQDVLDIPGDFKPIRPTNTQELLESFDKNAELLRKSLVGAIESNIMDPWTLKFGGKEIFTMPRVAVLRGFVTNHLVHHRAQLGVYLRLLDIPVPSTYGGSADEQT